MKDRNCGGIAKEAFAVRKKKRPFRAFAAGLGRGRNRKNDGHRQFE